MALFVLYLGCSYLFCGIFFLSLICFLCCSVLSIFFHLPSRSRLSPYSLLSNLFSSFLSSPSCLSSFLVVPFPSPLSQQLLPTAIFGIEWEQAILVILLWNNWEEQMIFFEQTEDISRRRQASKVKTTLLGNTCPAGSSFPTLRITLPAISSCLLCCSFRSSFCAKFFSPG